jgi:hypothetical protein
MSRLREADVLPNATSSETPRRRAAKSFMPTSSPREPTLNGSSRRWLPPFAAVLCLAAACQISCTMSVKPVKPTQATIEQIGLPIYPHAVPVRAADINQNVAVVHVNSLSVDFETSDPFDKVVAYYQARLPRTAQRLAVPMGFANDVTFQFFKGPYQKQVMIISVKDMRMISLRSMQLFQTPTPSASST